MDGLAIITGIAMMVFLLFYLAFSLEKQHAFLKIITVVAGVFMLLYIPQTAVELDKDCAVLSDGSYKCFYSNGTAVVDYGERNVGSNMMGSYLTFLYIFMLYLGGYYGYWVLKRFGEIVSKIRWRKS